MSLMDALMANAMENNGTGGGGTIDLDEMGIGVTIAGLIQTGGGTNIIESSENDPRWAKFIEMNPSNAKMMLGDIPVQCAIATKYVGDWGAYFGLKAFLYMYDKINEVTVAVDYSPHSTGPDQEEWSTTIIVKM